MYAIFKLVVIKLNKKLNLTRFQHSITYYIQGPNIVNWVMFKEKKNEINQLWPLQFDFLVKVFMKVSACQILKLHFAIC